ncbi:hypothetical protein [Streptomyces sp. NPDC002530]
MIGPALPAAPAYRLKDSVVWAGTPWFVDGDGTRGGADWGATGTLALVRDGRKLGEWSAVGGAKTVTVPAGPGRYTLEADLTRDQAYASLSTRVRSRWAFDSDTDDGSGTLLPLMGVRFTPHGLDASGGAARLATTRVDVTVQRAPGAVEAETGPVRLEVSWDDGLTWRTVELSAGTAATPPHAGLTAPADASYATLRATVSASDGSTVEQTVTRAFEVNKRRS